MNCPVCDGQNFTLWGEVGAYSILTCECGLGVTYPFPTLEELSTSNSEIYQVEQRIRIYLSQSTVFESRYRQYVNNIKSYRQGGRLLDVGCNIGLFLKVAREEGFEVTGVELNQGCAEYGKNHFGLNIHSEYLEIVNFPAENFDVVTLFDVLEHVPDLHGFLREVGRVLKPGGLIVVQSPNLDSLMAEITGSQWNWLTPPDHLFHFTPDSLKKLLYVSGFVVRRCRTWEPASEFAMNILCSNKSKSRFAKVLLGLNRVTRLVTLLVFIAQKIWWRKMRGGLVEVYAIKSDGA